MDGRPPDAESGSDEEGSESMSSDGDEAVPDGAGFSVWDEAARDAEEPVEACQAEDPTVGQELCGLCGQADLDIRECEKCAQRHCCLCELCALADEVPPADAEMPCDEFADPDY